MKILFYFGHPSQYLFLRGAIKNLRKNGITCDIIIKTKDVLENLLIADNEKYKNILPEGRKSGFFGLIVGLFKRDIRLLCMVRKTKYDLFIGTDPSLAHVGFIKRVPVITVLEDDITVISKLARITFPFTSTILTPEECYTGRYENKTVHYKGYMKLAYLHPSQYFKEPSFYKQPYYLIRISKLEAYHDSNIHGLNISLILEIIKRVERSGNVYICSESDLDDVLIPYALRINPKDIHHVLANASMLISDSQSMSMEAAMLGVPSIRFSDFAGKISVLETLEKKYNLTYGIPSNKPEKLMDKIDDFLNITEIDKEFQNRRNEMLNDKINVTEFLTWFIEDYPKSKVIMMRNPSFQDRYL